MPMLHNKAQKWEKNTGNLIGEYAESKGNKVVL